MFGRYNALLHGSPSRWDYDRLKHKKDGGDAPDFTALAAAADKAAVLGKELGDSQLAENQRQYDLNREVSVPVTQAQLGLMNMTTEQGNDYFNYMKDYSRPIEKQLYYESMGFTAEEIDQIEASRMSEISAFQANEQAQAKATIPTSFDVPTSSLNIPEGAIKGSDLPKGSRLAGSGMAAPDTRNMSTIDGMMAKPVSFGNNVDSNAYYIKKIPDSLKNNPYAEKFASWERISPELVNGSQKVTVDAPSGYQENSVYKTPTTDALISKLGMTAKARMDAMDKGERDAILAKNKQLEDRIGETNTQVYNRYANDIEAEAGQAVADSREGYTNAINVAARQGLRYGFSPSKMLANANTQAVQQAGRQAGAANQTRKAATETMYGRGVGSAGEAVKGITNNRNFRIQDNAIATAKKQDVAGLYRNLPSASQGSYSLATNAGNSAVNNQNGTSNQYMQGINQGNGMIMQGQQMQLSGLSSALQAQTSYANSQSGGNDAIWGALGQVGGAALSKYSDKNMKKDIEKVDDDAALEGIKKTEISKWKYDPDKVTDAEYEMIDDKEHIGAMAQDLQKNLGNQVSNGKMVDIISAVGVTMAATKALAKKVDKMEKRK